MQNKTFFSQIVYFLLSKRCVGINETNELSFTTNLNLYLANVEDQIPVLGKLTTMFQAKDCYRVVLRSNIYLTHYMTL